MEFNHIHSSGLHVKSSASLEAATDRYYDECSILTLTEVRHVARVRAVAEKGWGTISSLQQNGQSDVTVSYRLDTWTKQSEKFLRIYHGTYKLKTGKTAIPLVVATGILKHKSSGHRMLICAGHMPPTVGGANSWVSAGAAWEGRRKAYQTGIKNWNAYVTQQIRVQKPDIVLISADWNLGWNRGWVRNYMKNAWRTSGVKSAWESFSGPGSYGGRFIDGALYRGLRTDGTHVIKDDPSSDHRPIKTLFTTVAKAKTPLTPSTPSNPTPDDPSTSPDPDPNGNPGDEWWGFGDYEDDEIFHIPLAGEDPVVEPA
jgi:hypothetical protein